jgi:hypothetical protein
MEAQSGVWRTEKSLSKVAPPAVLAASWLLRLPSLIAQVFTANEISNHAYDEILRSKLEGISLLLAFYHFRMLSCLRVDLPSVFDDCFHFTRRQDRKGARDADESSQSFGCP